MKQEIINSKVVIINETFEESFETINDFLTELGFAHITEAFAKRDFGIAGGETNAQLYEWAHDYVSEIHTEKCATNNEWRYNI